VTYSELEVEVKNRIEIKSSELVGHQISWNEGAAFIRRYVLNARDCHFVQTDRNGTPKK
jgi:hypothetical protein